MPIYNQMEYDKLIYSVYKTFFKMINKKLFIINNSISKMSFKIINNLLKNNDVKLGNKYI